MTTISLPADPASVSEAAFAVCTLASSSKGNAIYVKCGGDELLIDAGISARRLETSLKSLGTSLDRIRAVFITHEHSDHIAALETISKRYRIPIHLTEPSARACLCSERMCFTAQNAVVHPPLFRETVGSLTVRSFVTPHDSAASVGYVVTDGTAAHSLAVATDIGCVDTSVENALYGIENVILESNHDENILLCGSYPYQLKLRILSEHGHLSNTSASGFAAKLARRGLKRLLLAHLSPENNLPELALATAQNALKDTDVTVGVAAMDRITRLV